MTGMESREWERERAAGRDRFVVREGILKRGSRDAAIAVVIWYVFHFLRHEPFPSAWDLWHAVIVFCFMTVIVGWFEGVRLWERREQEYEKYVKGEHPA